MKIRITAVWELEEDPNDWEGGTFEAIKDYLDKDPSYFMHSDPKTVKIEEG